MRICIAHFYVGWYETLKNVSYFLKTTRKLIVKILTRFSSQFLGFDIRQQIYVQILAKF